MIHTETIKLIQLHTREWREEGKELYCSSSFQTQSIPLLHIIGNYFPFIKIIFIDTGYLFPETYAFKDNIIKAFNLRCVTLEPSVSYADQIDDKGIFMYSRNPDRCCETNKVNPIKNFLREGDVWISGIRRDQTENRKTKKQIEAQPDGVIKFHPMLEWNSKDIYDYIKNNNLPRHPLEEEGYISIGCVPCTHKWVEGDGRGGRWKGSHKIECGLHLKKIE